MRFPKAHRLIGIKERTLRLFTGQRGIALLVTLAVIAVLVPTVLELNRSVRSATATAGAAKDRMALTHMADSGIQAAMALLAAEKTASEADSLAEDWADPDQLQLLAGLLAFEGGGVNIRISDERSRIQVNALVDYPDARAFVDPQYRLWDRFLLGLSISSDLYRDFDVTMALNSLKDWLDSGDDDAITGMSGAESDYYEALDAPVQIRNGPVMLVDELARIRGFDRTVLYGSGDHPGIGQFITPFGVSPTAGEELVFDGAININTASLPVLAAMLPAESTDLAQAIFEYRQAAVEDDLPEIFADPKWYRNAPGCADLEIDPALVTISSDLFRIEATAAVGEKKLTISAVVRRAQDRQSGKWGVRILRKTVK